MWIAALLLSKVLRMRAQVRLGSIKGQLVSKRNFGILEFFQKTNKRIQHSVVRQKNEFVRSFFGRIVGFKEPLRLCLTFRKHMHGKRCAAAQTGFAPEKWARNTKVQSCILVVLGWKPSKFPPILATL